MTLVDDLELIAENIGDDQPNLPEGAKNTILLAAKALRKMPTTADGVIVGPGDAVFHPSGQYSHVRDKSLVRLYASGTRVGIHTCYSTQKLASQPTKDKV